MKYIIPGFISSKMINNNLIIKNMYTQSTVELEPMYFEQYYNLFNNGCTILTTELENFLFENQILFKKNSIQSTLDYYD